MRRSSPIAALELGTHSIRLLVGEDRTDGTLMILGGAELPSAGIRKSQIVDFPAVVELCRDVIQMAEHDAQRPIREVHLVVSNPDVRGTVNSGRLHISRPSREITEEDIEAVGDIARNLSLPEDRQLLHSVNQGYAVDSQPNVINPAGMRGEVLSQNMLIIHGSATPIRNLLEAVARAQVDVYDAAFSGLCAALAVLSREQKAAGVAVIDLGAGTTGCVAYANQVLAYAGSIGVGGDHVTNDIVSGLRLPLSQAEQLKIQYGSAVLQPAHRHRVVSVHADGAFPERTVRLSDLHAIMHARLDELLRWIRADLDALGILHQLGAGIVLTGGSAMTNQIVELAQQIFNMPCVIGQPCRVSGLSQLRAMPGYAAVIGMLRYGVMMRSQQRRGGRLTEVLSRLLTGRPPT
ncbi:MAG: cell division protein FtsA [Kiritimatiellae bacterium]|nr:cell division protein FtsA [Kiritimatiellia bacterium]